MHDLGSSDICLRPAAYVGRWTISW